MKIQMDLDELVEYVDLPDNLFVSSLSPTTGQFWLDYEGDPEHLVPLPELNEAQIRSWMESFAMLSTEPRMRLLLTEALRYPAPERRFREVLSVNPQAFQEWTAFFDGNKRTILIEWLATLGVEL